PLAERIGMNDIKDELQDLSFRELNSDARDSVLKRLGFLREKGGERLIGRILGDLESTLAEGGVTAALSGREKTPYSIWRKMQHQQVGFEALSDIMAFRAVVGTAAECYQALGLIHSRYPLIPGRFKDYISTPKPNGYRSLHTGVVGPEGQRIELQIRTREMHDIAERGVAAHWQYKDGVQHPTDGRQYRWLQELLDILESAAGPEEFLEHTKLEMFHDQVFCFSPKGDVYALPQGATCIDFAYAVHSEVGDHCVGAKVNGSMVPLRVALQNGDQVEILTSSKQTPSPEWEQIVVTGKARSRIRRFVQREQQEQYVSLGRNILEKAAAKAKRDLSEAVLGKVLEPLQSAHVNEIYARVGEGLITAREVIDQVYPESKRLIPSLGLGRRSRPKTKGGEHAVPIRGLIPGMALHLAKCCYPLPGDRIVGIVTTGKGVTVHTIDCDTLANFSDSPERWLDVAWDVDGEQGATQVSRLLVVLINEPGSLGELASVIATHEGNISNLKFTNRTADFFDMMVDVEVRDAKHLANIVGALRAAPAIVSVSRARQ
ncbi:MAG: RelA/SpoT family protein, partial [Alphaproteobacteria bacterium]